MGGQGKSQVATEYCHRKRSNPYSAIFWIDATNEATVNASFQSVSQHIQESYQERVLNEVASVAFVRQKLLSWPTRWLLVFDNYDNPGAFPKIRDFMFECALGSILVTSRHEDSSGLVVDQDNDFIQPQGLPEQAAVELLIEGCGVNGVDVMEARHILQRLGHHPLAITQAGTYVRKQRLPIHDFLDHYEKRKKVVLGYTPPLFQYRKRTGNTAETEVSLDVFTTWELSFQQLESQTGRDSCESRSLTLFAFFDHKDISEEYFVQWNADADKQEINQLFQCFTEFYDNGTGWDKEKFKDTSIKLKELSLIQSFVPDRAGFCHASLYPLVKDWIRLRTEVDASQRNTIIATMLIAHLAENSWSNSKYELSLSTKQILLSHLFVQEEHYQEFFPKGSNTLLTPAQMEEYIDSQLDAALFLHEMGFHDRAAVIQRRAVEHHERVFTAEHKRTIRAKSELMLTCNSLKLATETKDIGVQILEASVRVNGPEDPTTLRIMNRLTRAYIALAARDKDEELLKKAEEQSEKAVEVSSRAFSNGVGDSDSIVFKKLGHFGVDTGGPGPAG